MGSAHKPRSGSMAYWPRKRARRIYPRVRTWVQTKEAKPLAFAGYKVGMSHVIITDNFANSMTKGKEISLPVTIIECPPLKVASVVFYKKNDFGLYVSSAVMASNLDKELARKIPMPKSIKQNIDHFKPNEYTDIRVVIYTQPKMTTIGKKKPEIFEIALGGKIEEKYNWAKEHLGKEIAVTDVFKEGQLIDTHSITTGKGLIGPMKRMGIGRTSHKSEKGVRTPGNVGPWHGHRQYRVAKSGQGGYHQRTEMNKWLLKINSKPEEINNNAGFRRYGLVKNPFVLVKGSVAGTKKRLIVMLNPVRPNVKLQANSPEILYLNKEI